MSIETDTATAFSDDYRAEWRGMQKHRSPLGFEKRQQLILDNLCEVRRVARRIHSRLPKHVLFDDLVHSGVVGLIDALEKFDFTKNVSLRSYAQIRIRGAILDSLREMDCGSRSLRRQARRIEQARRELIAVLGRSPSEPELAASLGIRLDKFQRILTELHSLSAGARQRPSEFTSLEEERTAASNSANEDPFQLCARAEVTSMLSEAVDNLGEKERRILALYYFEERTMKEVGTVLDLHESRISQIIGLALDHLRARLREIKALA